MTRALISAVFGLGLFVASGAVAGERAIALTVQNMYCSACPSIVKQSLEAVRGVVKVTVFYEAKTAVVIYEDTKVSVAILVKATTEAGYPSAPKN